MYYYFRSSFPAVIKKNGVYLGPINDSIREVFIDDKAPFIEICPINSKAINVNFFIDDNFLSSPPKFVNLTDLKGGYLINVDAIHSSAPFKVIAQKRFSRAIVTVFTEKGLKLSIETENDFFALELPFDALDAVIEEFYLGTNAFYSVFFKDRSILKIFLHADMVKEVFSREVFEYSVNDGLCTTEKLCDMAKHEISVNWVFDGQTLKEKSRSVSRKKDLLNTNLPNELVPYAFLEEFLASGKCTDFLSSEMKNLSEKLFGYLGDFIGVMPPPAFRDPSEVGLIYSISENLYNVEYFTFDVENSKICNLRKS